MLAGFKWNIVLLDSSKFFAYIEYILVVKNLQGHNICWINSLRAVHLIKWLICGVDIYDFIVNNNEQQQSVVIYSYAWGITGNLV